MLEGLFAIWLAIWLIAIVMMVGYTPFQISKDKEFISRIDSATACLEKFELLLGHDQFKAHFQNGNNSKDCFALVYFDKVPKNDYTEEIEVPTGSWAVGVWRGEWREFYLKWNKRYLTNHFTWASLFAYVLEAVLIGGLPVSLLKLGIHLQQKKNASVRDIPPAV